MKAGDVFDGKYEILNILGKGGMGTVYLARNIKLDTLWAVKEMSKRSSMGTDLLVECNILKRLNHPALPRIFDIVENEESIFIIADYIEGVSLDKELERGVCFEEKQVITWTRQICNVLAYLHEFSPNPIIYRDMKPSNIMVTPQGSVKLIDFGIAREYKKGSDSDTLYIGTRGYAAPEQYGAAQTSAVSDIYSLGVTLHHLLTGKNPNTPPFEVKPIREYNQNLSEKMEEIIAHCVRVNPHERYQSVFELLRDLDSLEEGLRETGENKQGVYGNMKTRYVGFKKLVLTVLDNTEFACEMACTLARVTEFKVLLMDLDRRSTKVNFYLRLGQLLKERAEKGKNGDERFVEALRANQLNFDAFEQLCIKLGDCGNLYILSAMDGPEEKETFSEADIGKVIEEAYKNFDVTILVTGREFSDPEIRVALQKSDYNIIAARANMDVLLEFQEYMEYFRREYNVSARKVRFIAWEYREGVNLPETLVKQVFGDQCYAGRLEYNAERERCKNLDAAPYAKTAWKRHREEYRNIFACFSILPEVPLGERMKNKIGGIFKRTGRRDMINE